MRRIAIGLTCAALLLSGGLTGGCASTRTPTELRASLPITGATPAEVMLAAEEVLGREFARLDVDRQAQTITAEPTEYVASASTGTAGDLYGRRSRMRRTASFATESRGGTTRAWLRIDIERQDTQRSRVMQRTSGRLSDTPGYTPIEEDAATTTEQNEVWTRVRRDRTLERDLLREISDRFAEPVTTQPTETP